jgi:hypothetical protein
VNCFEAQADAHVRISQPFPETTAMEDEIYTSTTHIARVHVMETSLGSYVGYVYLRRAEEDPEMEAPFQTDSEYPRDDLARDAARALASRLLEEYEF